MEKSGVHGLKTNVTYKFQLKALLGVNEEMHLSMGGCGLDNIDGGHLINFIATSNFIFVELITADTVFVDLIHPFQNLIRFVGIIQFIQCERVLIQDGPSGLPVILKELESETNS